MSNDGKSVTQTSALSKACLAVGWTWCGRGVDMPSRFRQEFGQELQSALMYLYDPAALRRCRLINWLGLPSEDDLAKALCAVLLQSIEARKPGPEVPFHTNAWRIYHILRQRYVECLSQREIAANLGISTRQLRRLHASALDVLGDDLLARYGLAQKSSGPASGPREKALPSADIFSVDHELAWLADSVPTEAIGVSDLVQPAVALLTPLTQSLNVTVVSTLPEGLPPVAVRTSPTRHALLNILKTAIHLSPEGQVRLSADARSSHVWLRAEAVPPQGINASTYLEENKNLDALRRLLDLSEASLVVNGAGDNQAGVRFTVGLPLAEEVRVLFAEDNADALRLFACYLEGTRYRFSGCRDARQVLSMAQEIHPRVIVLDLMLPHVDGWEILARLREHPRTSHIPVIVCTILPEEELAAAFGAAELIRKPVSREEFLFVLDRQVAQQTESE